MMNHLFYVLPLLATVALCRAAPATDCMLEWLVSIGIDRTSACNYNTLFSNQQVDQRNLRLMTKSDLLDAGITSLGHRVFIFNAASQGKNESCHNGGSCDYDVSSSSYQCTCLAGFSGSRCLTASNGCSDSPCQNGGTCSTGSGSTISCRCPPGFHGDLCQHTTAANQTLVQSITDLTAKVERIQRQSASAILDLADTFRRSTGLRFFKEWLELDIMDIKQIRNFTIGNRDFLGVISTNSRQVNHGLVIYEITNSEQLKHRQTIQSESISSFKPFQMNGNFYIVVANYFDVMVRVDSKLYVWNGSQFVPSTDPSSDLRTTGVKDVDFTEMPGDNYFLAFAAHDNMQTYDVPTYVFRYHPDVGNHFIHYQNLPTKAAQRVHFFTHDSETYLLVAQEHNLSGNYHTNSSIFRWNSTYFELFQQIVTDRAYDLVPFEIGCHFFLVAVNNHRGSSYNLQSKVYRLHNGMFVEHDTLETRGATMAQSFRIGTETFLAMANSYDDNNGSYATTSDIYLVDGPRFIPFQEIPTQKAMYMYPFKLKSGRPVLAIANEAGKSKLYKWCALTYRNTQC